MSNLIADYIGQIIILAVTAFVTWFFSRKQKAAEVEKLKAEVSQTKADSSLQIMQQYQSALDDLKKRYEERHNYLTEEYARRHEDVKADFERKYQSLKKEYELEISNLERKVQSLSRSLEYWKKKYKEINK